MTDVVFCNNKKKTWCKHKAHGVNSECEQYKTSSHSIKVVLKDIADLEFFFNQAHGKFIHCTS